MTFQHNNRNAKPVPSDGGSSLPMEAGPCQILTSDFVNLRFSTRFVDNKLIVSSLQVEAVNPKVSGDKRVFDLSFLLPRVSERNSTTVAQVVDPRLSMDARLDALRVAVVNIAGVTEQLPPLNEPRYGAGHSPSADGLEPSFSVKQVVLTHLGDLLRGYSRRGVTLVRNAQPWIQFHITENEKGMCDASLVVLPTGLELPLLDRSGCAVTEQTLNGAIHDITHLLLKGRYEPELKVLEALALELTQRLNKNPDAPRSLTARNFGHEIIFAARDGILWAEDSKAPATGNQAVPVERNFEARELPDGRVLWIRHRSRRISSELSFVIDSLEGGQSTLSFHYPPHLHPKVARVAEKLSQGAQWPSFLEITDLLHAAPRTGLSVTIPTSSENYASAVNALVREIHREIPEMHIQRGLFWEPFGRFAEYLPDFVSELVKGRSPFSATIESQEPSDSWWIQGFLDRDLKGSLFAINALGASIVVSDHPCMHSPELQHTQLVKFYKTLSDDPSRLTHNPKYMTGMRELRRNLPDRTLRDAMAYSVVLEVVSTCWKALVKEGGFSPHKSASDVRWYTNRLAEGVWSVSLLTGRGVGGWLPYLINFTVTKDGVMEIAYSHGRRGLFGSLLGSRIWSQGACPIEGADVHAAVRAIAQRAKGSLPHTLRHAVRLISPSLDTSLFPWSSLRYADPDRKQYDLLSRLWEKFKAMW